MHMDRAHACRSASTNSQAGRVQHAGCTESSLPMCACDSVPFRTESMPLLILYAVCSPGSGWDGSRCSPCWRGSYSPGGNATYPRPLCISCPEKYTTASEGSRNASACDGGLVPAHWCMHAAMSGTTSLHQCSSSARSGRVVLSSGLSTVPVPVFDLPKA